jgi:cyclophilin family peptidyl-prolyl cis-trans isomerase
MNRLCIVLCLVAAILVFVSQSQAGDGKDLVRLSTSKGAIVLDLDRDHAPVSVENFLRYVDNGFYDGTLFHRVIPGFMIQGGGLDADMNRKPTLDPIRNESNNGLGNRTYSVSMARTNAPHSATSQFFINVADNAFLNGKKGKWGYAVFGEVIEGQSVVKAIESVVTTTRACRRDVPVKPVTIDKVERID